MTKRRTIIIVCVLVVLALALHAGGVFRYLQTGTSEPLQEDFDIARLNDLVELSGYIEQYWQKTGKYPYQSTEPIPVYVFVATQEQAKYTKNGPPYEHIRVEPSNFVAELVSVLGDSISVPFDPQRVPVNKPNFYLYMVAGENYYLAVHLHQEFEFANHLGDFYSKVEVTNDPLATRKGTWRRAELLQQPTFQAALKARPNKPGYVEDLRSRLGGNSAF